MRELATQEPGSSPSDSFEIRNWENSPKHKTDRTSATTDKELIEEWIELAEGKSLKLQRIKEGRRLLMWLQLSKVALSSLNVSQAQLFLKFAQEPPPEWKGPALPFTLKNGQPNPAWRPFVNGVKGSAAVQMRILLINLMDYAVYVEWCSFNPFRSPSAKLETKLHPSYSKVLSESSINYLNRSLQLMWENSPIRKQRKARALFLISLLLNTGLRREEIVNLRMNSFMFRDGSWWIFVVGKGSKEGLVPLPVSVIPHLMNYREVLGLGKSTPVASENGPAIFTLGRKFKPLSYSGLYREITTLLGEFSQQAVDLNIASELKLASTHWFRHTSATIQLRSGIPLKHVQKNLRHSSVTTTEKYLHILDQERAESIEKLSEKLREISS